MPASSFVFPGYPAYLEAAGNHLGRPDSVRAAGRLVALTALANLCAQASRADPADVGAILTKAHEFRDQLAIALQAADAMLADVEPVPPAPGLAVSDAAASPAESIPPAPHLTNPARRKERPHDRVRDR